jgi:2',3'-cyclic-nucleotide 2'-phosphodiesterase (5'-nucleotidase family)
MITGVTPDVAAIFNGHTHKQYSWNAPVPGVEGKTRPIVQTGSYGEFIGQIQLTVDTTTVSVTGYKAGNAKRTAPPRRSSRPRTSLRSTRGLPRSRRSLRGHRPTPRWSGTSRSER